MKAPGQCEGLLRWAWQQVLTATGRWGERRVDLWKLARLAYLGKLQCETLSHTEGKGPPASFCTCAHSRPHASAFLKQLLLHTEVSCPAHPGPSQQVSGSSEGAARKRHTQHLVEEGQASPFDQHSWEQRPRLPGPPAHSTRHWLPASG